MREGRVKLLIHWNKIKLIVLLLDNVTLCRKRVRGENFTFFFSFSHTTRAFTSLWWQQIGGKWMEVLTKADVYYRRVNFYGLFVFHFTHPPFPFFFLGSHSHRALTTKLKRCWLLVLWKCYFMVIYFSSYEPSLPFPFLLFSLVFLVLHGRGTIYFIMLLGSLDTFSFFL